MPIELRTPAEVAEMFGTTERALIRFANKHRVPIVEMKRGVYRFTEAAILQLQEAAQARSVAASPWASGRSGSWTPASSRVLERQPRSVWHMTSEPIATGDGADWRAPRPDS